MASPFPHHYEIHLRLDDATLAEGLVETPGNAPLAVGPPAQFDGRPGHQSPEELLLAAIASCHMTTFVALSRRKALPIRAYRAVASGKLEKTREGLRFTAIGLRVEGATAPGQEAEMRRLLELAESYCIVSAALRLDVALEVVVSVEP